LKNFVPSVVFTLTVHSEKKICVSGEHWWHNEHW